MPRTAPFPPSIRLPSVVSGQYVHHWYAALWLQSEAYHMTKRKRKYANCGQNSMTVGLADRCTSHYVKIIYSDE